MSELQVVAVIEARTGSEGPVQDALSELVRASRAEDGCVAYELNVSQSSPTSFVTVEKWRSQEDLDAHMKSPHIAKALTDAGPHLAGAPAIHPLTVIPTD